MRASLIPTLLAISLPLSITAQQCGGQSTVPAITVITFPAEIPGDASAQEGQFTFTDGNAGVRYAYLDSVVCPSTFTCPEVSLDLQEFIPEIESYNAATVSFDMSCMNNTAADAYFVYSWTLEDIEGNLSDPKDFSFQCIGTNKSPVPQITSLSFPSTVPGNGSLNYGQMAFVDGNAGVKYATLKVLECPAGFTCPSGTSDLSANNPDIVNTTSGTIQFSLSCTNSSGQAGYSRYSWTLEDIEGNQSNAWEFAFSCTSSSRTAGFTTPEQHLELVSGQGAKLSEVTLQRKR